MMKLWLSVVLQMERHLFEHLVDAIDRRNFDNHPAVLLFEAFENVFPTFVSFLYNFPIVILLSNSAGLDLGIDDGVGLIVDYASLRIHSSKVQPFHRSLLITL